jgi:hypothetical protein
MEALSICYTTEEMADRMLDVNLLSSILARKAGKLYEELVLGEIIYHPHETKSLGKLTKELDGIQKILYTLGKIGDTL